MMATKLDESLEILSSDPTTDLNSQTVEDSLKNAHSTVAGSSKLKDGIVPERFVTDLVPFSRKVELLQARLLVWRARFPERDPIIIENGALKVVRGLILTECVL